MGRAKHEQCWIHVTKVENGKKWICKHCSGKFSGGATRIEAHLGGKRGGIRRCSNYHGNQEIHNNNNMASTSSNPPEIVINRFYSTHDQDVHEVFGNHLDLINHQNIAEIMNSHQGVAGSSCNESEINQLKQLVIDLECEENDITKQLQWLESRGKKRKLKVDVWLEGLLELKESVDDMNNFNDIDDINELIKDMKRLKEEKPLILSCEFVGKTLDYDLKRVLKLLEDNKVFVIGICGMGGVGKTLLATLVKDEVMRKKTSKEVFWVTVSENTNISKLQQDIAKRIGVKLDEDDERIRAEELSSALEKKEKLVLILDDVWKYMDLEKVGIHRKVKVILTTRITHVCHQMDCQLDHVIFMNPLGWLLNLYGDEDFELFMLKLGRLDGTPRILPHEIEQIARRIVKRFWGLPLGINVMARTMKGVNAIWQWKYALNKLEKMEMGQEMEEEVFKVLKRSYDNLMERDLQNYFLYCALLSNDVECSADDLIMKLVDSGLINGNIYCLEEILDEGNAILKKLKDHSLEYTHSLMKDMACYYILKESKKNALVKLDMETTKISFIREWVEDLELVHFVRCSIKEIPEGLSPYCPRLSTLIMNSVPISHVPESFFEYMNILTILDFSYNNKLESLPNSIAKLRCLVSLVLKGCMSLKHVPPLGDLQTLSRLVITGSSIEEAPQGLDKLLNLKWLDLSFNKSLSLAIGSLSDLTKMQYLDLRYTHDAIKVEDVQGMNKLECFGGILDCKDYHYFARKMHDLSFELKTYDLIFLNVCGESRSDWSLYQEWILFAYVDLQSFDYRNAETKTIQLGDCDNLSHTLPIDLTCLLIYENIHLVCLCDALSYRSNTSSLRILNILNCQKLQSLFCLLRSCSFCTKIHNLEKLKLENLESLTVICKDVVDVRPILSPSGMFSCLRSFNISKCNLIETLLTPRLVQHFQNLETITVSRCGSMKEIFSVSSNDENESSIILLPKLTRLELLNLPQLKIVCKQKIRCGSSQPRLIIDSCPNLETYPVVELRIPYSRIFATDVDPQVMF